MEMDSGSRESSTAPHARYGPWAAWLLIGAGLLALATLPLGWARVNYPAPGPTIVVESVGHVRAGLLVGVFMLFAGAVALLARSLQVRRAWLVAGVVCGVALGAVAVFDLLTERARVIDGLLRASARAGVAPPANLIQYSVRPGIVVALVAAALAVVAGTLVVREAIDARAAPDRNDLESGAP